MKPTLPVTYLNTQPSPLMLHNPHTHQTVRVYVRFGETTSDTRQSQGVQWQLQAVAPYIPKSRAIEKVLYSDGP